MKKIAFIAILVYMTYIIILPLAGAIIEEDWGNYTRINETKKDSSGTNITFNWLKKSYFGDSYKISLRDFDAQGFVVLDISYRGRNETIILKGEWNDDRTKIVLTEPVEAFNKTMRITPARIVPPAGIYTCCPEAEINIDLIRPELVLELETETRRSEYSYRLVNPYANWTFDQSIDPYDNSSKSVSGSIEYNSDSYRMHEEIPMNVSITNHGDAESTSTAVYIDTDGLKFEDGYSYYQLPTLSGEDQRNFQAPTGWSRRLKLKFPDPPTKLNYTVHAYVKGVRGDTTYYYDATKTISLLPSMEVRKSVTGESMLLKRKDVEKISPSIDSDDVYRWLQGGDIFVTIGVTNYQKYEIKRISLSDMVKGQFTAENKSLNWTFDLKPFESKEFKYKLTAGRPGNFTLPPAMLTYPEFNRSWILFSNTPSTEVHGPCVQVYKKTDRAVIDRGENTTITVTIKNSGDMPSRVKAIDTLPENFTFLQGRMYYEGVILPKESVEVSYVISVDGEGQVMLPDPEVYVNDEKNYCGEPITSRILIKDSSIPMPAETVKIPETPKIPEIPRPQQYNWLEGAIPALLLVLAVIVLIILQRS